MSATETLIELPAPPATDSFEVVVVKQRDSVVIRLLGTLDAGTSLLLEEIVDWLRRDGYLDITLDATALKTVHTTALIALYRARAATVAAGGSVHPAGSGALALRFRELLGD